MYICTTCHYASATKLGKCPNCGEFGSFMLDPEHRSKDKKKGGGQSGQVILLTKMM